MRAGLLLIAASLAMRADSVNVSGPVSAVVFDGRSQSIRLVTGVSGASLLGATLADNIRLAEISPDGNSAVVVQTGVEKRNGPDLPTNEPIYAVSGLTSGNPAWVRLPIADHITGVDLIVWNANSSAAALYSTAPRAVFFISNISSTSASQTKLSLDSLSGEVTALALDGAGTVIVAVSGDAPGIYRLSPKSAPMLVASVTRPEALSIVQDKDLLIADADSLQIFDLANYSGAAQLTPFANLPRQPRCRSACDVIGWTTRLCSRSRLPLCGRVPILDPRADRSDYSRGRARLPQTAICGTPILAELTRHKPKFFLDSDANATPIAYFVSDAAP